jgi:tetratricopeptide (TPR) repeat protein
LALEQAGRLIEAAAAYEQIAATNPAAHLALAHHLVRLYARAAATNAALRWAGQVMKTNPDPQAYLAGVHSLLGNHAKARAILERELKAPGPDRRRMTLLWQLADALAALGDRPGAEASLRRAEALAQGTPDQAVAERRLSEFVKGGGELQGSPAAQGGNAPPKPAARE